MSDLNSSLEISASGLRAESARIRVVAQNIANADSLSTAPGGDPYRRKTITFHNVMDKELGHEVVKVSKVGVDPSPFELVYDPHHPASDAKGYYKKPNVDTTMEMQDMREAQRTYEANVTSIEVTKSLISSTLGILR